MEHITIDVVASALVFCAVAYASICLAFGVAYPRPAARRDQDAPGKVVGVPAPTAGRVVIVPFASDWAPARGASVPDSAGDPDYAYAARRTTLHIGAQVAIRVFSYQPALIHVPVGTTVRWTNQDNVPHTVTFTSGEADSGVLAQGKTFDYTFATPGVFDYFCRIHPNMTGIVHVTM
jgi:plastocyanin